MACRRSAKPARNFEQCQFCGYIGLFWPAKATRDKDLHGPLDKRLAICITRAVPASEYDVHTWDGYFSREGWKAEGKRTAEDPTDDGRVFRVAPVHRCDPDRLASYRAAHTLVNHHAEPDPRVPD